MMEGYFLMDGKQLARVDLEKCYSIENMKAHMGKIETVQYKGTWMEEHKTGNATLYDYYLGESGRWWYRSRTMNEDGTIVDTMKEFEKMIQLTRKRRKRYADDRFGNIQELEGGEEQGRTDRNTVTAQCM